MASNTLDEMENALKDNDEEEEEEEEKLGSFLAYENHNYASRLQVTQRKEFFHRTWGCYYEAYCMPYPIVSEQLCIACVNASEDIKSLMGLPDLNLGYMFKRFVGDEFQSTVSLHLPIVAALLKAIERDYAPSQGGPSQLAYTHLLMLVDAAQMRWAFCFFQKSAHVEVSLEKYYFHACLLHRDSYKWVMNRETKIKEAARLVDRIILNPIKAKPRDGVTFKSPRSLYFDSVAAYMNFLARVITVIEQVFRNGKHRPKEQPQPNKRLATYNPLAMIESYSRTTYCEGILPLIATEGALRRILSAYQMYPGGKPIRLRTQVLHDIITIENVGGFIWKDHDDPKLESRCEFVPWNTVQQYFSGNFVLSRPFEMRGTQRANLFRKLRQACCPDDLGRENYDFCLSMIEVYVYKSVPENERPEIIDKPPSPFLLTTLLYCMDPQQVRDFCAKRKCPMDPQNPDCVDHKRLFSYS